MLWCFEGIQVCFYGKTFAKQQTTVQDQLDNRKMTICGGISAVFPNNLDGFFFFLHDSGEKNIIIYQCYKRKVEGNDHLLSLIFAFFFVDYIYSTQTISHTVFDVHVRSVHLLNHSFKLKRTLG